MERARRGMAQADALAFWSDRRALGVHWSLPLGQCWAAMSTLVLGSAVAEDGGRVHQKALPSVVVVERSLDAGDDDPCDIDNSELRHEMERMKKSEARQPIAMSYCMQKGNEQGMQEHTWLARLQIGIIRWRRRWGEETLCDENHASWGRNLKWERGREKAMTYDQNRKTCENRRGDQEHMNYDQFTMTRRARHMRREH